MDFLYFLEGIRNPFLDTFFSIVTRIGEETVFICITLLIFWCVSKREGYYMLVVGFVGLIINQFLKLAFRIDRPFVRDPNFTIVESARAEATGYSFPSGHTQSIAGTFGTIARFTKRKVLRVISIVIILLVAFSRMYLGVHTPLDVIVSLLIGAALCFLMYPIFANERIFDKAMPIIVICANLFSFGFVLYTLFVPMVGMSSVNLASGMKYALTLMGATVGLAIIYLVDTEFVKFDTKAPWYAQILKFAIGAAIVVLIKSALASPLVSLFGNEYIARGVRYMIIIVFAGAIWPATFKYFAKMRVPVLDRMTEKIKLRFCKK